MSKPMNQTMRGHNPKVMVATVVLAMLIVLMVALAFMLQPAATTGASNPGIHATSAGGAGGSSFATDPYLGRHAEVVARYHQAAQAGDSQRSDSTERQEVGHP